MRDNEIVSPSDKETSDEQDLTHSIDLESILGRPSTRGTDVQHSQSDGSTVVHTPMPSSGPVGASNPVSTGPDSITVDSALPKSAGVTAGGSIALGPAHSATKNLVGQTLGDYRIDAELGKGGMGVVYRAHHLKLRRDVALKMIHGVLSAHFHAQERFAVEARAIANLQHSNVVQLFEFGQLDGSPYVALEYVEGGTLADRIKECPLSPRDAASLVEQVARAIQTAHDRGILHRDLKPANILLTPDGHPKITDFGLAKELVEDNQEATRTGTVLGTPSYMSPEQALGHNSSLTGSTDQYSLGAILYACVSGRPPFMASSTIDTITQVVHKEPIPPRQLSSTVPVDLDTICLKALQKAPEKRYANCAALADDLRRFLTDQPIAARPIGRIERAWRWSRRNPKVALLSSLAAISVLATSIVSSWAWMVTSAQAAVIAQERDNVKSERDEANKQKLIANQQKAAAEENAELAQKQSQLALKNIQFVLTDVDKLLRGQPGMTDMRIGILESVSKKWDQLNVELAGGVRGQAVPTLMAVRQQIAIAFMELDRLKQAEAEFQKLEEMARERVSLKNRNDASRLNLARILMVRSPLYRRLEDNPQAGVKTLEEAIELVREVLRDPRPEEGSPTLNEIEELLAAVTQNLGVELLREGRIADAEKAFGQSLEANTKVLSSIRSEPTFKELSEDQKDTRTAGLQISLDKSKAALAYVRLRLGRTEDALPLYQEVIASRREIYNRRSKMLAIKSELAGQLAIYGKSLVWLRRLDDALPLLNEASQLGEEVWQADLEKTQLKRAFSDTLYHLGSLRRLQGREGDALSLFERSRLLRAELSKASSDEKNRINLMISESSVGNIAETRRLVDELGALKDVNSELHLERSRALAQLLLFVKEEDKERLKNDALDALDRAVKEGFRDPFRLKVEPELAPLQETERFAAIVGRLAIGNPSAPNAGSAR